ncbi:GSCFA domain-containing protein [Roseibium aggregatum]|uniref:GSCFA domain-containing protein n=1 Tax=Roseibium aggregatum TaxID=187304 RepID=UPI001E2F942A|nr:GSCFA domain-containing protein [Roseibium aggregatum]UES52108.1 hypothetical protein GFK88_22265 [Roseibium aggregatum]
MPIFTTDATAFDKVRKRGWAYYPGAKRASEEILPVVRNVISMPKILEPRQRVFTVGSCFARNIEKYLSRLGFDVPMAAWADYKRDRDPSVNPEYLNKYTIASINNELRWALGETPFDESLHLHQFGADGWYDPQCSPTPQAATHDQVRQRRNHVTNLFRTVTSADTVVVTLGLVETWYDRTSGISLNYHPHMRSLNNEPDRFEMQVRAYDELIVELDEFRDLIRQHNTRNAKIVVSVSPVPLAFTFRDCDVLEANTYSKSVLRAVADAFTSKHDDCFYFPSYEIATLSDPELVFGPDNRHIRDEFVGYIVFRFLQAASSLDFDREAFIAEYLENDNIREAAHAFLR